MGVVSKGDGRARAVGVGLLAVAVVVAWWAASGGGEPAARTGAPDAGSEAPTPVFDALGPPGALVRDSDPVPTGTLRLWMSTPAGARLCAVGDAGDGPPLEGATCEDAPLDATRTRLGASAPGAPPLLLRGESLVALSGTPWWSGDADVTAAFVTGAGTAAVLAGDRLLRVREGEVTASLDAPPAVGPGSPALVWDRLMWIEGDRLFARPALVAADPVEIGAAPAEAERLRGCRSNEALAAAVHGRVVHGVRPVAVTFHDASGWSAPVASRAGVYEYDLSCRGREATLTWLEASEEGGDSRRVVQVRCTPEGCDRAEAPATFAGADPLVADLAGKVLLVWAAQDGTRARLAPLVELATAPDLGELPEPAASPVLARRLFVRRGVAVLVYRTRDGLFGLRIDAGGRVEPLAVRERGALQAP